MDGFSAANGGAQRHQYLLPAACASNNGSNIDRTHVQRLDSTRYHACTHHINRLHRNQAPSSPKQQNHCSGAAEAIDEHQPRSQATKDSRDKRGPPTAPEDGGIDAQPKNGCATLYIATIEKGEEQEAL